MPTVRCLLLALLTSSLCHGTPPTFMVPAGERQLFLDDFGIAAMHNLVRTMHRPEKRGAVVRPDRSWERTLQTRSMPAWDEEEKVFKLWMITSTNVPGMAGTTYAVSPDGVRWSKPVLGQWEFQGSRENNFIALDPKTGRPIESFGENGAVNLLQGLNRPARVSVHQVNSPPMICNDVIVVGSVIFDRPTLR